MLKLVSFVLLISSLFRTCPDGGRVGGWLAGEIGNIAISAQMGLQAGAWAELGNNQFVG